jgi:hypothetical protein
MDSRKSITEAGMLDCLARGEVRFPPLTIEAVQREPPLTLPNWTTALDAQFSLRWGERVFQFAVECRRLWTPKAVAEAAEAIRSVVGQIAKAVQWPLGPLPVAGTSRSPFYPLVLVPYLGEEQLTALEAQKVSGLDLCGNGVVVVPGELLVFRTGFPNRFRSEAAIKNVYRKNSSMVARAFLLVPEFSSVQEAREDIRRRGGEVSLATVSKVCSKLDADLVITRTQGESSVARRLRLLQPDTLLDRLAKNYAPPEVNRTFTGKYTLPPEEFRRRLVRWEEREPQQGAVLAGDGGQGLPWETRESRQRAVPLGVRPRGKVVLTGASSVEAYAVMAREPVQSYYCTDLDGVLRSMGDDLRETDRFANVNLLQTRDGFVYFDRRPGLVASPIQTYLELANGDKRERETAEQVRRVILEPLTRASSRG